MTRGLSCLSGELARVAHFGWDCAQQKKTPDFNETRCDGRRSQSRHPGFKRAPLPTYLLLPSGPQRFSITSCLHFPPCCSPSQCRLPCFTNGPNPTPFSPWTEEACPSLWCPISHSSANCCHTMSINLSGVHTLPPPVPRVVWLCGHST